MQFLLSYEAHVSSLSLLHFEDSIEAADQISDKEPEGVHNSSEQHVVFEVVIDVTSLTRCVQVVMQIK